MKKVSLFFLVILVSGWLSVPSAGLTQPKYGGTIVIGLEGDIEDIDPQKPVSGIQPNVFSLSCENLVLIKKDLDIAPGLAESWDISDDLMVWTFHLRKGVKFHNGR